LTYPPLFFTHATFPIPSEDVAVSPPSSIGGRCFPPFSPLSAKTIPFHFCSSRCGSSFVVWPAMVSDAGQPFPLPCWTSPSHLRLLFLSWRIALAPRSNFWSSPLIPSSPSHPDRREVFLLRRRFPVFSEGANLRLGARPFD